MKKLSLILTLLALLLTAASTYAQPGSVRGTVMDENGVTMPGVSILVKGTSTGATTDLQGRFSIAVAEGQTLVFRMVGFESSEVKFTGQASLNVKLKQVASALDEVVVVGYKSQAKKTLTSAVSTVTASEIVSTKNENILNSLAGKVPGLRIVQNTSEPGAFNTSFDIRGMGAPLIVIDGIPRPDIARVDPNDVESISVMKDASAAVYGVRAANGVILITTKKGKKGELELNYTGVYGMQVPTGFPKSVDAVEYLTLANEKNVHSSALNGSPTRLYNDATINDFATGVRPGYDWQDLTIHRAAGQTQHNLGAIGGSDNASYYISVGYMGQDGILKSNDLFYDRFNLRSNLTAKISKSLSFDLSVLGTSEKKEQPMQAAYWVFRSMWYQPPINAPYANNNPAYLASLPNPLHPIGQSNKDFGGFQTYNNKWFQSSASINYDVPFVKGLSVKGLYSFDMTLNSNKIFNKSYNRYSYNATTDTYTIVGIEGSPSTIRREIYEYPTNLGRVQLDYTHRFNEIHNVNALLLYEASTRRGDNFNVQRNLVIPVDQIFAGSSDTQQGNMSTNQANAFAYKNASYVGSLGYDFKSKYLAKFAFRYDGSSRFAPDHAWGFFPVGEIGWRISEEKFFKDVKALSLVSSMKFRASYGETGDEGTSSYQFVSGYNYPPSGSNTSNFPAGSVFNGSFIAGVQSRGLTNPLITWITAKTLDVGVDVELWNGKLGFIGDFFRRDRTGLLLTQSGILPDVVGAALPSQNINSDRNQGIDFEVTHRHRIGKFAYNLRGIFAYTRIKDMSNLIAPAGNSYLNWRGANGTAINPSGMNKNSRITNIYWGYGYDGQWQSYNDIKNAPIYVNRNTVTGDYRYEDWNGDGQIGLDDSHPIANTGLPLMTFGMNVSMAWKNFDASFLIQGAAMSFASYQEQLGEPLWAGGSALTQWLDRWHPVDPNADPYSPSTAWTPGYYSYTGTNAFTNTLANTKDASYVRLKSAELGYNIPKKIMSKIGVKNIRIYFSGYNLFTVTGLKFLDPEHPSALSAVDSQFGYGYPIDKIYSMGLNVKF